MAVDPAQSFSNALGQGLGIMKSYRDEARDEEEMEFSRQLRIKNDSRLDASLKMDTEKFDLDMKIGANTIKLNDEYWSAPEVANRAEMKRLELSTAKSAEQVATINAKYADQEKRMSIADTQAGIGVKQAQVGYYNRAGRGGGGGGGGGGGNSSGLSRENQAFMEYAAARARGQKPKPSTVALIGRKQAVEAAMIVGATDFAKALQNPFGDWRKDPKAIRNILPYAGLSIGNTEKAKGYRNSTVVGMDINPKNQNEFVITFNGVNAKTGKRENYTGRQNVDTFLDKGSGYASVFGQIANSPVAKADIAQQFIASKPVEALEVIDGEIKNIAQRMKNMKLQGKHQVEDANGEKVFSGPYNELAETYTVLTNKEHPRYPYYISEFLLKGLARQEQSRY